MRVAGATNIVCPMDGGPLESTPYGARCKAGHGYDRAREGYLNLLLVQHKSSRDPGDDKAMVAARRRILDDGFFGAVAAKVFGVVQAVAQQPRTANAMRIVDAGCGEGYYLRHVVEEAKKSPDATVLELAGIDISKWAVRAAAKRSADVTWAVATNGHLPLAANSVHLILSMFGFPVWENFRGVQSSGGRVLLVDPGADHLIELRSVIYPTVERGGPPGIDSALAAGYRLESEVPVRYQVELAESTQIQTMVAMTPHVHRMSAEGRAALARLERQSVTIDVTLRLLRLSGEAA